EHDRQKVLNLLYRPHHEKFSELVDQTIKKNGQVIIIDCHSFPSEKRWYEPGFKDENPLPDICIGTDPFHTPKYLSALMLQFFQEQGYSVAENFPFAGSITPLEHYEKTPSVYSIMVEINRKLYMDEHLCSKHSGFSKLVTQMAMLGERMGNLPSVYTCDRD
ncbi:MAG: N-formylglutamate amidohydrolase, partial [Pseudomonadota bacterium]